MFGSWELLGSVTPAGVGTIAFPTFTAHDILMLVYDVTASNVAPVDLNLRINGFAGNVYRYAKLDNGVISTVGGVTSLFLQDIGSGAGAFAGCGFVLIRGRVAGSQYLPFAGYLHGFPSSAGYAVMINGAVTYNATDVVDLTVFVAAGNMTGTLNLYGKNL